MQPEMDLMAVQTIYSFIALLIKLLQHARQASEQPNGQATYKFRIYNY